MQAPPLLNLGPTALVDVIAEELENRCSKMAAMIELSQKIEHYTEKVEAFVRCINVDFFDFIDHLDRKLRDNCFGSAKLTIDDKQPELVEALTPYHEWAIKHFSLLRARLMITLKYHVKGKLVGPEKFSAKVQFNPDGGSFEWADGSIEVFRSHRANAYGKAEFGGDEFLDLYDVFASKWSGFDLRYGVERRYDPQFLVSQKILRSGAWQL